MTRLLSERVVYCSGSPRAPTNPFMRKLLSSLSYHNAIFTSALPASVIEVVAGVIVVEVRESSLAAVLLESLPPRHPHDLKELNEGSVQRRARPPRYTPKRHYRIRTGIEERGSHNSSSRSRSPAGHEDQSEGRTVFTLAQAVRHVNEKERDCVGAWVCARVCGLEYLATALDLDTNSQKSLPQHISDIIELFRTFEK